MSETKSAAGWYFASVAAFMIPTGIQSVLLSYLLAIELHQPAQRFGVAQMLGQLPVLMLWRGQISEAMVLTYAIIWGVISAFALPARDGMLNRVAGSNVQRTVTMAMGIQFGTQMLGQALSGRAGAWGPIGILMTEIGGGLSVLFSDPTIRATFLLICGMGVFFAGVMVVLIPLAIRDLYAGGAQDITIGLIAFGLGSLVSIGALIRIGGGVAMSMSMSRTIMQENAPATHGLWRLHSRSR